MELSFGLGSAARLIAHSKVLSSPFVLIDVGARGGINERWRPFEPAMRVFGFDAETLVPAPNERQRFFEMAIGDRDGECFISTPDNRCQSRIDQTGRPVAIRKLDTLFASGAIPPADFIKIDVESYEPEVLAGGAQYLKASNLLGADLETTFNSTTTVPQSHIAAVMLPLLARGLRVADFTCDRPVSRRNVLWPGICNVLFVRDATVPVEVDSDALLKLIAVLDVYGLPAQARAILNLHRTTLQNIIDVDKLRRLLVPTHMARIENHLPNLGLGMWSRAKQVARLAHW